MSDPRTAVVVGASSGIGRALAHELARAGHDLVLGARDLDELRAIATDLELRHGIAAIPLAVDLCGPDDELERFADACLERFPTLDAVLVPAGGAIDDDDGRASWEAVTALVTTNFLAIAKLATRFLDRFDDQDRGTLVLFSSIATAAPRGDNIVYGASKAALTYFGEAQQHRFAGRPVHVQVCVLGYVDTAQTSGMDLKLPVADPHAIAATVVAGLGRPRRTRHLPRFWRAVTAALRALPWPVYRRLKF